MHEAGNDLTLVTVVILYFTALILFSFWFTHS